MGREIPEKDAPGPRSSGPGTAGRRGGPPHQGLALAAVLFAVSMAFIDQTIVAIAARTSSTN